MPKASNISIGQHFSVTEAVHNRVIFPQTERARAYLFLCSPISQCGQLVKAAGNAPRFVSSVRLSVSPSLAPSLLSLTSHATLLVRADDVQTDKPVARRESEEFPHSLSDGERTNNERRNASERKSERAPSAKPPLGAPPAASRGRRAFCSVCRTRTSDGEQGHEREGEREKSADADEMRGPPPPPVRVSPSFSLEQPVRAEISRPAAAAATAAAASKEQSEAGEERRRRYSRRTRTVPDDRRPSTSSTFGVPTDIIVDGRDS